MMAENKLELGIGMACEDGAIFGSIWTSAILSFWAVPPPSSRIILLLLHIEKFRVSYYIHVTL